MIKELEDKKILILGFGQEGISTLQFLRKYFPNKKITIADQKELMDFTSNTQQLLKKDENLELNLGKKYLKSLTEFDLIIKSPGISLKKTAESVKIKSQTVLFFENCKGSIIGITGTKGKSTTSSLIYKILKDANLNAELIGNIGSPPLEQNDLNNRQKYYIFELSSFQLENLNKSPHIAVLLNIFPEHLDYHGDFDNYKLAKLNITKWQDAGDYLIYNKDSENLNDLISSMKAKKIAFSKSDATAPVFLKNKKIMINAGEYPEFIIKLESIPLLGEANVFNVMASIAVAKILKIPNDQITQSISSFKPLAHRLEKVAEVRGIEFYDDSIATIPEATIAALQALNGKVETLILGGHDRGLNFDSLAKAIIAYRIKTLILFPTTGAIILKTLKKLTHRLPDYFETNDMRVAVKIAFKSTNPRKTCLLSPAASSFGLFKNYQDRGDQFAQAVKAL